MSDVGAGCLAVAAALFIVIGAFMLHPGLGIIILGAYLFLVAGEAARS